MNVAAKAILAILISVFVVAIPGSVTGLFVWNHVRKKRKKEERERALLEIKSLRKILECPYGTVDALVCHNRIVELVEKHGFEWWRLDEILTEQSLYTMTSESLLAASRAVLTEIIPLRGAVEMSKEGDELVANLMKLASLENTHERLLAQVRFLSNQRGKRDTIVQEEPRTEMVKT